MASKEPKSPANPEPARDSVEWIRAQLDRMRAEMQAGTWKTPEDRETILQRMGYGDYQAYLYGALWGRIRRRVLRRDNHSCVRCSDKAREVHHLSYTELVLNGEDDAQLVSLCADCHERIEFDGDGKRRIELEKRRVLDDRDGARQEKTYAEQARVRAEELTQRVRTAAGGRCFRCKGDTENQIYHSDGQVYVAPITDGTQAEFWSCSACRRELDYDKASQPRTNEEKLKLLREKVKVRYTRPAPATGFHFRKTFWRLNAMQREGIMNEFHWNAANILHPDLETSNPQRFHTLRTKFESTKANGLARRK